MQIRLKIVLRSITIRNFPLPYLIPNCFIIAVIPSFKAKPRKKTDFSLTYTENVFITPARAMYEYVLAPRLVSTLSLVDLSCACSSHNIASRVSRLSKNNIKSSKLMLDYNYIMQ